MARRQYTKKQYTDAIPRVIAVMTVILIVNSVVSQRFQEVMNVSFVVLGVALVLFLALNKKKIEERYKQMKAREHRNDQEP